jgi:hypothetical protein
MSRTEIKEAQRKELWSVLRNLERTLGEVLAVAREKSDLAVCVQTQCKTQCTIAVEF